MPATPEEFLDWFAERFEGRSDIHAEGYPNPDKPGKYLYALQERPLDQAKLKEHLSGRKHVGVYPIANGNKVKFFAIDFDGVLDDPEAYNKALGEAKAQKGLLEMAGLFVYLERSRSGAGVHLWGFLSDWVDAGTVLDALRPNLLKAVTFDRIFPVQSAVKEMTKKGKPGRGNLIGLPFAKKAAALGNAMFIDDKGEVIPMLELPARIKVNPPSIIEEIASRAPKEARSIARKLNVLDESQSTLEVDYEGGGRPPRPITGVLKLISEYGCKFMNHCFVNQDKRGGVDGVSEPMWYAAIQQMSVFQFGEAAARQISKTRTHEFDDKWANACEHPPVGCAYIHEHFPELACKTCPMKAPYHIAERSILELVQESSAPMRRVNLKSHIERVRRRDRGEETAGVPLGIPGLDEVVRARQSELIVAGAMPSMGKTALMVDASISNAKNGIPSMVFSAETAEGGLYDRFLAHESGVDSLALRGERRNPLTGQITPLTDDEWQRIGEAETRLNGLPLFVNFTDINADQVLANIERVLLENGISFESMYVVFFDYLQFGAKLADESNYERVSRLSTEFKNIAKITKRPVVVFSQLVRNAEGMEEPNITMFKESGRIEQDADVALILSGDRVEGQKAPRRITVVKQREGPSQVAIDFILHQHICHFEARQNKNTGAIETDFVRAALFEPVP